MDRARSRFRWVVITISEHEAPSKATVLVTDRLQAYGHRILEDLIIPPDHEEVGGTLDLFARDPEVDLIMTLGATGPGARDVAPDAADARIGKVLPGFGERFRQLAYEALGPAAWMERARAATLPAPDAVKVLFQLPDDGDACELALADLVLPAVEAVFAGANPGLDLGERFTARGARRASD